jgi:hypothetical protein
MLLKSNNMARKDKIIICPACDKKIQPKYDGQIYCNLKCYANSEKLKQNAKKSYLIINNKTKKWRKGTGGRSFTNKTTFKKEDSRVMGKNNPRWKGGITKLQEKIRKLPEYKSWRNGIFKRDNWTCKICKKRGNYIEAHHLKEFNLILKHNNILTVIQARRCTKLWEMSNGISLCRKCHDKTKTKYFKKTNEE